MTDNTTYNGWTNRATWLVPLWIDNEYGSYKRKQEFLQRCYGSDLEITAARCKLYCRRYLDATRHAEYGLWQDLSRNNTSDVGHRWCDINWEEIAQHWRDEQAEMVEYLKEQDNE